MQLNPGQWPGFFISRTCPDYMLDNFPLQNFAETLFEVTLSVGAIFLLRKFKIKVPT
ncbi:hypothetical protein TRICHSKD4_5500 [Roseibium sp. TrichSKD4]|nr:hypothetical protein TRICHSKD4_5500 [Roseibium sp. TrichSKD4]